MQTCSTFGSVLRGLDEVSRTELASVIYKAIALNLVLSFWPWCQSFNVHFHLLFIAINLN